MKLPRCKFLHLAAGAAALPAASRGPESNHLLSAAGRRHWPSVRTSLGSFRRANKSGRSQNF